MAKYNDAMEHIAVSDEMKSRVLNNVDQHFKRKKRTKQLRLWLPLAGIAVAAAVLLMVMKPWAVREPVAEPGTEQTTETPVVATGPTGPGGTAGSTEDIDGSIFQENTFSSAEELATAAGFSMKDVTAIPFTVTNRVYHLIEGKLAEIIYVGAKTKLDIRKSKGNEDISGVYEEYPVNRNLDIDGVKVKAGGDQKGYYLVRWWDGTYSYSIFTGAGMTEDTVRSLVKEINDF